MTQISLKHARQQAADELLQSGLGLDQSTALLEADLLLAFVLQIDRSGIFSRLRDFLSDDASERFRSALQRRLGGEPFSYIARSKEFFGRSFYVDERVLIPRPETELLVEAVLREFSGEEREFAIVDVGVGSGAIILSLAKELEERLGKDFLDRGRFLGTDISAGAVDVAERNSTLLGLQSAVQFRCGHLLDGVTLEPLDGPVIITANLPYIGLVENVDKSVRDFEPIDALFSGPQGLDLLKEFISELPGALPPGSQVFLEIGASQSAAVESLILQAGLTPAIVTKDLSGRDRLVVTGTTK